MFRKALIALPALLLAACGEQQAPVVETPVLAEPLPAMVDWVTPLVGKAVTEAYPNAGGPCRGYVDSVDQRYGGSPSGTAIGGWGWDAKARAPFAKIVVVDGSGMIQGGGASGVNRADVPAAQSDITTPAVGFTALTTVTGGEVRVFGVDDAAQSHCLLGQISI